VLLFAVSQLMTTATNKRSTYALSWLVRNLCCRDDHLRVLMNKEIAAHCWALEVFLDVFPHLFYEPELKFLCDYPSLLQETQCSTLNPSVDGFCCRSLHRLRSTLWTVCWKLPRIYHSLEGLFDTILTIKMPTLCRHPLLAVAETDTAWVITNITRNCVALQPLARLTTAAAHIAILFFLRNDLSCFFVTFRNSLLLLS